MDGWRQDVYELFLGHYRIGRSGRSPFHTHVQRDILVSLLCFNRSQWPDRGK